MINISINTEPGSRASNSPSVNIMKIVNTKVTLLVLIQVSLLMPATYADQRPTGMYVPYQVLSFVQPILFLTFKKRSSFEFSSNLPRDQRQVDTDGHSSE